jgi:hypothetical protein
MNSREIFREQEDNNPITVISVVSQINKWSNSIPNHPFKNLGNEISVTKIKRLPSYLIRVRALYESRRLYKSEEPYRQQTLPKLKYASEKEINIWDINLQRQESFSENINHYTVSGSEQLVPCSTCKTTGSIICPECKGHKKMECDTCDGKGYVKCKSCYGEGSHRCSFCNGLGYKERFETYEVFDRYESVGNEQIPVYRKQTNSVKEMCHSCYGKGKRECSSCRGKGTETCKTCGGDGHISCKKCSATGKITCTNCKGSKYMVSSYNIEQKTSPQRKGKFIINNLISQVSKEYSQRIEEFKRTSVFTRSAPLITPDLWPQQTFIEDEIKRLVDSSIAAQNSNYKIVWQSLEIEMIETLVVDYSFKGKSYNILFAGTDMTVIAGESPIAGIERDLIGQAEEEYQRGNEVESFNLYLRAKEIDSFNERETVSKGIEKSFNLIEKYHKKGRIIGAVLSTAVILPYLYHYYFHINKVFGYADFMKNPDFFLFRHHPWVMLLVVLLFQYSAWTATLESLKSNGKFSKSRKMRIFYGALTMILLSVLLQSTLILLNATGFTLIFTIIGWLFTFWV